MARMGRPPKPIVIKEIEGNPGKRPLNKREPKPEPKIPSCPIWLLPDVKTEWESICLDHKPALSLEVDWAGSKIAYYDTEIGKMVEVFYLFQSYPVAS